MSRHDVMLFAVAELAIPICKDTSCDVVENPAHYVSIHLSDYIKEAMTEAIKYLTPDSPASPVATVLIQKFQAILETDKTLP